jgi:hypothetical protein
VIRATLYMSRLSLADLTSFLTNLGVPQPARVAKLFKMNWIDSEESLCEVGRSYEISKYMQALNLDLEIAEILKAHYIS